MITAKNQLQALKGMDHAPSHFDMLIAIVAAKVGSKTLEDGLLRLTANA